MVPQSVMSQTQHISDMEWADKPHSTRVERWKMETISSVELGEEEAREERIIFWSLLPDQMTLSLHSVNNTHWLAITEKAGPFKR